MVKSLGQLPPFPAVLNKLLASLNDEDISYADVAQLIEKDAVLSANVLRLVNSAIYGRRGTITSITHAISILGINKLRNTVLGFSISRMWTQVKTPSSWSAQRFNLHSVATALMSDLIAQNTEVGYPEGAFMGGMMHDLGKLLAAVSAPEQYEEIRELYEYGGRTYCECEQEVLGIDHPEMSSIALREWNFPARIQTAVRYHHAPESAPDDGTPVNLSLAIRTASGLVSLMGVTVDPPGEMPTDVAEQQERLLAAVGLEGRVEDILPQFQQEFDAIKSFF